MWSLTASEYDRKMLRGIWIGIAVTDEGAVDILMQGKSTSQAYCPMTPYRNGSRQRSDIDLWIFEFIFLYQA
jgi:hypothetical protein